MTEFIGDDGINWDAEARRAIKEDVSYYEDVSSFDYFSNLLKPGMRVLDLGCNISKWNRPFKKLGLIYEGLDGSPTAIKVAKERFPENTYYLKNAKEMSFHERFDVVFTHTVLQHMNIETKKKVIPKVRDALKDDGLFIIEEKCDVDTKTTFIREKWINLIESYGFTYLGGTPPGDPRNGFVFRKKSLITAGDNPSKSSRIEVGCVLLTLNEQTRIEPSLNQFKKYVDYILVLDGESTDRTVEIARKIADRVEVHKFSGSFAEEKNYARTLVSKSCRWILWADADEIWDEGFLAGLQDNLQNAEKDHVACFRFARINLPDARNYPDYQVRLFLNSRDILWRGQLHEIPYLVNENIPLDSADKNERTTKLGVCTIDKYPLIHLPRRKDLSRIWWKKT